MSAEHSHLLLDTSPAIKHPISIDDDSGQQIQDSNSISPSNGSPPVGSGTQTQAPPSICPYKGIAPAMLWVSSVVTVVGSPGISIQLAAWKLTIKLAL